MQMKAVKIKIMPSSPESNLKDIEANVRKILEENNVKNPQFEIEPIAFGLKAIIVMFGWPEDRELEILEEKMGKIRDVSSIQVLDIRRAIG